jgi:hypothetical protein
LEFVNSFPNEEAWKGVFSYLCIKVFLNNIFTRRYWIHFPPICIPIVFNWIWIQFNWILIQLLNNIEFKYIEWISILYRKKKCLSFQQHFRKNLVPQWHLLFPYFSMFLVWEQIKRIYCMLHIASYHHYPWAEIDISQGYFNISCHCHMNMKWVFYVWEWTFFLLHYDLHLLKVLNIK